MSAKAKPTGLFSSTPSQSRMLGAEAMQMPRANQLVDQNLGLNFMQRALQPEQWPVVNNPDGGYSTHLMMWDKDLQGNPIVFPSIVWDGNRLQKLSGNDAWHHAVLTGEMMRAGSPEEADWFSNRGYKLGAGTGLAETTPRGMGGLSR